MPKAYFKPSSLLLLAPFLVVSFCFVYLGFWQLSRSYSPQDDPGTGIVTDFSVHTHILHGQRIALEGQLIPEDTLIVSDRYEKGESTWWLVARYNTPNGALPAVLGYGDRNAVATACSHLKQTKVVASQKISGRFYYDEPPDSLKLPESGTLNRMSSAAMINMWRKFSDPRVFSGFVVLDDPPGLGLGRVSILPGQPARINWLNIFYAVEWFLFAGFCLYVWFYLVRTPEIESCAKRD